MKKRIPRFEVSAFWKLCRTFRARAGSLFGVIDAFGSRRVPNNPAFCNGESAFHELIAAHVVRLASGRFRSPIRRLSHVLTTSISTSLSPAFTEIGDVERVRRRPQAAGILTVHLDARHGDEIAQVDQNVVAVRSRVELERALVDGRARVVLDQVVGVGRPSRSALRIRRVPSGRVPCRGSRRSTGRRAGRSVPASV